MRAIGIRELRQRASSYLREVEQGETIEVRDRGRPVAWLVPVPGDQGLAELVASGRVAPATGDLADLGPPLAPRPGAALPSDLVAQAREDER